MAGALAYFGLAQEVTYTREIALPESFQVTKGEKQSLRVAHIEATGDTKEAKNLEVGMQQRS